MKCGAQSLTEWLARIREPRDFATSSREVSYVESDAVSVGPRLQTRLGLTLRPALIFAKVDFVDGRTRSANV